jgi:hypothetical protein
MASRENLVAVMRPEWPTDFIRTDARGPSSRPGEHSSTQRPDTFTQTVASANFNPLAVRRRTIHYHQTARSPATSSRTIKLAVVTRCDRNH